MIQSRRVLFAILWLLFGLALLYFGAEALVRGSVSLALRAGLSPLVAGLTVVAYGTSAPELVVSVTGALQGNGSLALGNAIGSNIFNVAAILGLTALITPLNVKMQLVRIDAPIALAAGLLAFGLAAGGVLPRWGGILLLCGAVVYSVFSIAYAKRTSGSDIEAEFAEAYHPAGGHVVKDVAFVVGGILLLVAGSQSFVGGAVRIATILGVSEAVIGLTIVAAGTSTPELAASIVAALRKEADVAVGNIVGSNIFNMLAILGAAGAIVPLQAEGITAGDWIVMLVLSAVLIPLMWSQARIERWEGALLLCSYGGYVALRWPAT